MAKLLERDWAFVREGSENLEAYLLSPELYWPLGRLSGVGGGVTQLTPGNLLLSQKRLSAVNWPQEDQEQLEAVNRRIEDIRNRWRANLARKSQREYAARLKLWMDYLDELFTESGRRFGGYASEVRWRAILKLLEADIDAPTIQQQEALANLDSRLRSITRPGEFVWEPEVAGAFPHSTYWYLYVSFRET